MFLPRFSRAASKTRFIAIMIAVVFVVLTSLSSGVLLYGIWNQQWDTPFIRSVAATTHVPAAKIGKRTITYTEYLNHLDAAKRFVTGPAGQAQGLPPELTPDIRKAALDRVLRIAAVDEFAAQQDIIVTPLDVNRVYDELIARAGTSTSPGEIESFLMDQFGWSQKDFKEYVIRPAMTEDLLKANKLKEDPDTEAFEKTLQARLARADVKKYLQF